MKKEEVILHGTCTLTGVEAKVTYKPRVNGYKYRLYLRSADNDWYFYRASDNLQAIAAAYHMIVNNMGGRGASK